MARASKEVVTRGKSTAMTKATAFSFEEHAGAGLEHVTTKDLLIPRLTILQGLSPQVNKQKPEFIKGAEAGNICDVGTMELFDAPLPFVPVHFVKQWLEWAPRASGKGLIKIHDNDEILDQTERDDKNRSVLSNGNYIAETAQFFGLNGAARWRPSFIPMVSTQLKKSRRWLTWANGERLERQDGSEYIPPLFYRVYNLGTVPESNAEGDWYGWSIERGEPINSLPDAAVVYAAAVAFRASIARGEAKGDVSSIREEVERGNPENERM